MALDIGEKRIGIAISDPDGSVATPLQVLDASQVVSNGRPFRLLIEDWEPEMLLCGLPLSLDSTQGKQAERVKEVAETIANNLGLPLSFCDERLSSKEAKRILREKGLTEKAMRGKIDMIAASLFLQTWLDSQKNH